MSLLPCEGEADGARVHGFISSPAAGRGSRAQQYFFCNGRWIRSAALQAALEQAYRNTLLVGRFPRVRAVCAAQLRGRGRERPPGQDRGKVHARARGV